jgi:hypothetical protein
VIPLPREPSGSEIPGADEFEFGRGKIGLVSSGEPSTIDARDGGYHSVGRSHAPSLLKSHTHNVAVSQRGSFSEAEDPVGKPMTPMSKALLQPQGALVWAYLADAECDPRS